MRRKFTQVMMLSLLLTGAATALGGYVYAEETDSDSAATVAEYVPGKPTVDNVKVGEVVDGKATVTFTITTPSTYWDPDYEVYDYVDGLTEITKIVIAEEVEDEYGYSTYKEVQVVTEGIEIGKQMTIEVPDQEEGQHTYSVFALNTASKSSLSYCTRSKSTSRVVTVGFEAPDKVTNLKYVNEYPKITLTWDAPTAGKNGGEYNASQLTYTVSRDGTQIAEGLTEPTYVDNLNEADYTKPTKVSYSVVAKTNAGSSAEVKSSDVIVGPAYTLPFAESFKNGNYENLWSKETQGSYFSIGFVGSYSGIQTGIDGKLEGSYDDDKGTIYFKCNSSWYDSSNDAVETYGQLTSSNISLVGAKNPVLSFYQYVVPGEKNNLKASVIVNAEGTSKTLDEYTFTDTENLTKGWVLRSYSLADFAGKVITISFRGDCSDDKPGFTAYDKILIENVCDKDLLIKSFTTPASVDAGSEYEVSAEVYNKGSQTAENFSVDLYLGEKLLKSEPVASLAAGESTTVTFKDTAVNAYGTSVSLTAKINFTADEDLTNNEASATLAVKTAAAPAVTDLSGSQVEKNVKLTWSEPDYKLPAAVEYTESFEDYAHKATSFGDWTMSAAHSYGPSFYYYGVDEDEFSGKATFTVVGSQELALDDDASWYGKATDGTHYLMNTGISSWTVNAREDWLISPVLGGAAQTVSFKIASRKKVSSYGSTYSDHVKVLYSTTTNDQSAFTAEAVVDKDITAILANGDDFETVEAALPEGAKYFAIIITTAGLDDYDDDSSSIVFLDEIKFVKGNSAIQAELLGYNVFEGETQLNESLLTETSFEVVDPENGEHSYTVVAVYNVGDAEASEAAVVTVNKKTSGVDGVDAAETSVVAGVGEIHIVAAGAQVYDIAGRLVAKTAGESVVRVAGGTYVVRADGKTVKVLVK